MPVLEAVILTFALVEESPFLLVGIAVVLLLLSFCCFPISLFDALWPLFSCSDFPEVMTVSICLGLSQDIYLKMVYSCLLPHV